MEINNILLEEHGINYNTCNPLDIFSLFLDGSFWQTFFQETYNYIIQQETQNLNDSSMLAI